MPFGTSAVRARVRVIARRGAAFREMVRTTGLGDSFSLRWLASIVRQARSLPKGPTAIVSVHALRDANKVALVDEEKRLTYRELDEQIDRAANALSALGVGRGDRVALMMRNCRQYLLVQWATTRLGAVAVQIGYRLKAPEIAHILSNAEPIVVVHHADFAGVLQEAMKLSAVTPPGGLVDVPEGIERLMAGASSRRAPRASGGSETAGVMVYTSGTTGKPKGARRSFEKSLHDSVLDFISQTGIHRDDRHLVVCPLYHSAAPLFVALSYLVGATVVLREHFDPEDTLRIIERERITSAFMVPTMLGRIAGLPADVRARYDTSSLRWMMSGAAPLPTDTARRVEESLGPVLYNFYGSTETGLVTLARPGEHVARPGTIGRALLGNEIRLLDEQGREVPVGEVGEIYVRNSMLVEGYHRDSGATERAMRDGFFSVGDLGRVDAGGYYYLADRKHDMVISGGVNIYPLEIEQRIHEHPSVLECAVIGVPDPDWGEALRAFVVRRPGGALEADEVRAWCKEALADYKCPRTIEFLEVLPRLPTGKVLRRELRTRVT
jgi:fatty-acyl-CoA synthase